MLPNRKWAVLAAIVLTAVVVGCTPDVREERAFGVSLYQSQRHVEAMATFRHCIEQRPNDAESNYYMGLCYRSIAEAKFREDDIAGANRELDMSLIYFGQAIREWPNYAAAIQAQNEALERRGKNDEALARAKQIAKQNRPDTSANIFLGKQYAKRGDYDNALLSYKTAIKLDPNNAAAYAEIGRLYFRAGDIRLAGANLRKAYQINPNEPGVAVDLERVEANVDARYASDTGQ